MAVTCSKCNKAAVYVRRLDKTPLCKKHFNEYILKTVRKTISKYNMFKRDDKIAVALSGGKDSVALLHVLNIIEQDFKDSELVAITIDEGIKGYRDLAMEAAKNVTRKLGIPHHVYSFKEYFNKNIDEIVEINRDKRIYGACTFCGVFRRTLLNKAARELEANKLATGHNLHDEVETILLNILRGDPERIARLNPSPFNAHEKFVPRVKPFRLLPQDEIVVYAVINDLEYHDTTCPHAVEASRGDIRDFIVEFYKKYPHSLTATVAGIEKILPLLQEKYRKPSLLKPCKICGEPTVGDTCMSCRYKLMLNEFSSNNE